MDISLPQAYDAFRCYASRYDMEHAGIVLKVSHIVRVARKARQIASALELSQEDIDLAELIGLLHDIGRFEQLRLYDTFRDYESVNHGLLGCQVLFGDGGIIRDFVQGNSADDIIYTAVINHNRAAIDNADTMDARTLMHSKIVRDADKADIYKVQLEESNEALYRKPDISQDVLSVPLWEDFLKERLCDYRLRQPDNAADSILCSFGYVYDIYFAPTHAMVLADGYLARLGETYFEDEWTREKFAAAAAQALAHCRAHAEKAQ